MSKDEYTSHELPDASGTTLADAGTPSIVTAALTPVTWSSKPFGLRETTPTSPSKPWPDPAVILPSGMGDAVRSEIPAK